MRFLKGGDLSPAPNLPFLGFHSTSAPDPLHTCPRPCPRPAPDRGSGHLDPPSDAEGAPASRGDFRGSQCWILLEEENSTESPRNLM